MSQSLWWKIAVVCIVFMMNPGCTITQNIRLRSELKGPLETGPLTLLAKDSALYTLTNYRLMDSSIVGTGSVRRLETVQNFSGELKLSDLGYIQAQRLDFFKGLFTIAFTGCFIAMAADGVHSNGNNELTIKESIQYVGPTGGGGHSCPFVYSWDGKKYVLEGEAFGVGLGKALEVTTSTVLNSLKEEKGLLTVRLTNERPETHYFNAVKLAAVETDANSEVYSDASGTLWPVYAPVPPIFVKDNTGKDITPQVSCRDDHYWESDLAGIEMSSDFQDMIDLVIANPEHRSEGSLIIHAMNTHISEGVFGNIFSYLGDETLSFIHAAEHDSVMIQILKNWQQEASLKAFLFNGSTWERIGLLAPEANNVQFSKLIRFKLPKQITDTVRIRLTSLADVWKIDALSADWTPVKPLKQYDVPLLSASGPREKDLRQTLHSSDDQYTTLMPWEKIDLQFTAFPQCHGKKIVYAISVGGYLYEWPTAKGSDALKALSPLISTQMKIPYLQTLLQNKSIFLPVIYSDWRSARSALSAVTPKE